jgi:hypothetical protein
MSCLFNSLSAFVDVEPQQLRNLICDKLSENGNLMDDLTCEQVVQLEANKPLENYVTSMRQAHVMGGATEIKVFCLLFKKNVSILSEPNKKIIEFCIHPDFPVIHLRWTGNHYDPVHKK